MAKFKEKIPKKTRHQNSEGKVSFNHGKPPHRGGVHSGGKRKIYFTEGGLGRKDGLGETKVASPWKPNVRRNKFKVA